ncbi:beta-1,3-galactosyltransferase 5-like [Physella acuta]|uniref:beta-1,3-galactosyltransferase 5-like n=1 Tax=Physella acuta TaxID=109671 RepID=UPI0027DC1944|nr:beta-1,3-galactosyltransferase 5-like [Physella acuta]
MKMLIRVTRSHVMIPVKVFYLCLLTLALTLYLLRDHISLTLGCADTPTFDPRATDTTLHHAQDGVAEQHIFNISRDLKRVPRDVTRHPRGPGEYFTPREHRQQKIIDTVLLAPWALCVTSHPFLIAVQLSLASMTTEREAVRTTWASAAKTKIWPHEMMNAEVGVVFVLGREPNATETWGALRTEADKHGDILLLDMTDNYTNLTLKIVSGFTWLSQNCPGTDFFLKVDMDTFVNLPVLVDLLIHNRLRLQYAVVGHMYTDARRVHRTGRWAVDRKLYPLAIYPPYASGCAYIVSVKALTAMTGLAPYVPMLPIEDAHVTGVLARHIDAHLYGHPTVFTHFKDFYWQRCQMLLKTKLVGTHVDSASMYEIWGAVLTRNRTCFPVDRSEQYELIAAVALSQKSRIAAVPLSKKSRIAAVPLSQKSRIAAVPLSQKSRIAAVPLSKKSRIAAVPLSQKSRIAAVPLYKCPE